ncbi:MAG: DUF1887 family protein [Lachnospiraceae bacterium]|nr:DUF1887 family protein [Lachnospiraceae bacterium]
MKKTLLLLYSIQKRRKNMLPEKILQIQDHLFWNPLPAGIGKRLPVLVKGWGMEAECLVDQCIQLGPCCGRGVRVRVLAPDAEEIERNYLMKRPALAEYVRLQGREAEDPLAELFFADTEEGEASDYVFAADAFSLSPEAKELDRMAFQLHLAWAFDRYVDVEEEEKRFYSEDGIDERISSRSCALSVLRRMAIAGYTSDPKAAAAAFIEQAGKDPAFIRQLATEEHKRWILEKVTAGWQGIDLRDVKARENYYQSCLERESIIDEEQRIHPCIARCREEQALAGERYCRDNYAAWDLPGTPEEEAALDDLDLFSLTYHQFLQKKAGELRKDSNYLETLMTRIRILAESIQGPNRAELLRQWRKYHFDVKRLLDGNSISSRRYPDFLEHFCDNWEKLKAPKEGKELLAAVRKMLYPVAEANRYRDYKDTDLRLMQRLPVCMTCRTDRVMGMIFICAPGQNAVNDCMPRNVAAPVMLRPRKLIYLLCLKKESRPDVLERMMVATADFFFRKRFRSEVRWVIAFEDENTDRDPWMGLFRRFEKHGWSFSFASGQEKAEDFWIREMKENKADLVEMGDLPFSDSLRNAELVQRVRAEFPVFSCEPYTEKLYTTEECRELKYPKYHEYMSVEEMFRMSGGKDKLYTHPALLLTEYSFIWKCYTGEGRKKPNNMTEQDWLFYEITTWNTVCMNLAKLCAEKNGHPDSFSLKELLSGYKGLRRTEVNALIQRLAKGKLLLQEDDCFRFRDDEVRSLLIKAGDALELCLYYAVCDADCFDDVASGYHFLWGNSRVDSELDLVATKGFRSLMVECKARQGLAQEYYLTLNSLGDMFGIGAVKVMLTTVDTTTEPNRLHVERGNMMDIVTIQVKPGMTPADLAEELKKLL